MSERMFQIETCWMDFDESWNGHYASSGHPKFILLPAINNTNMTDARTCVVVAIQVPLSVAS
jgi:hypothetical protein